MTRNYRQKRRAERQEQTRQRIIEAVVDLHQELGPANTTISAIAERARVQRLTVYRHFPDERSLLLACSSHYVNMNPLPDAGAWRMIADPASRMKMALTEVYAYHERTEPMMEKILRDAASNPLLLEINEPFLQQWQQMIETLAAQWGYSGERHRVLVAAIGHALDFTTWRSLVRQQQLSAETAIKLMVNWVGSTAATNAIRG